MMSRLRVLWEKLNNELKYSASNPINFDEIWSFQSTGIRLISLIILYSILVGFLFTLLVIYGPLSSYLSTNDVDIDREILEKQNVEIVSLSEKLEVQDAFISNISKLIHGQELDSLTVDDIMEMPLINYDSLNENFTQSEQDLAEKINENLRMNQVEEQHVAIFGSPVVGEISQDYNERSHVGVDIVTKKGAEVKACLSGTVIYSGFTQKDGYMIIIDHGNGFLSIYKHNKTIFKKIGDKVQLGDPISIVGNTGENTTGPHLHFELWHNGKVVDPSDYINFKK